MCTGQQMGYTLLLVCVSLQMACWSTIKELLYVCWSIRSYYSACRWFIKKLRPQKEERY